GRIWFLKWRRRFGRPGGPFAEKGLGQNKDPPLNLRRYSAAFGRLTLDLPVVMIAQKMLLVPIIKCCFQEEPGHAEVSHLLETPVGCVHAAAHDGEFTPRHLLALQVILSEMNLFMKSAKLIETAFIEEHEHAV